MHRFLSTDCYLLIVIIQLYTRRYEDQLHYTSCSTITFKQLLKYLPNHRHGGVSG